MVVVAADVVIDAFVDDMTCCGHDRWWWSSRTSFLMRLRVTWHVVGMVEAVVATDVIVKAAGGWWWSRTSLLTCSWVTWRVHNVAGGATMAASLIHEIGL